MTTFRCSALLLVGLLAPLPSETARQLIQPQCANINPAIARDCVGRRVARKEQLLEAIFKRAMRSVRKNFARYGQWDKRSDPAYLTRSQAAWKQYVDNDCKVQAAFGGGSNSSISDREIDCYEGALDKRIEFLRQLADETFGVG